MNAMLGEKIAITSEKPQTTRNTVKGIYTKSERGEPVCQIVFIDTPGIHKPKNRLGSYMTDAAVKTLKEVDAVLFIVDSDYEGEDSGDGFILKKLRDVDTPKILVINKIDRIDPERFERIYKSYEAMGMFDGIVGTNALEGKNADIVLKYLEGILRDGPMYFPEDMITDDPLRFLVAELLREKLLHYLKDEVPHGTAVEIESFEEAPGLARISALIYCERNSHKGIIIGKGGHTLKGIATAARRDIEALLGTRVFLEVFVKVREGWRDSDIAIANLGYDRKKL